MGRRARARRSAPNSAPVVISSDSGSSESASGSASATTKEPDSESESVEVANVESVVVANEEIESASGCESESVVVANEEIEDEDDEFPSLRAESSDDEDSEDEDGADSLSSGESMADDIIAAVDFSCVNRDSTGGMDDEHKPKRQRSEPLAPTTVREICSAPPCDHTVPDIGLQKEEMEVFLAFNVPHILLMCLAIMFKEPWYSNTHVLDAVEFFSGKAAVTSGMLERGLRAIPYDVLNDDRYQDICGNWGFVCALQHMRSLTPCVGSVGRVKQAGD